MVFSPPVSPLSFKIFRWVCLEINVLDRFSCGQGSILANLVPEYLRKIYIQDHVSTCRNNKGLWDIKSVIGVTENNYFIICFFHYMSHMVLIFCPNSFIEKRFRILFLIGSKINSITPSPRVSAASWKHFLTTNLVSLYNIVHC